jgi:hypothetical protein
VAGRLEPFHKRQERDRERERERERERDAAGRGFSQYLCGAAVNGLTSMAAREVTLHDHGTRRLERIQIYHISLLQFTQIQKSVRVQSLPDRCVIKTARIGINGKYSACKI